MVEMTESEAVDYDEATRKKRTSPEVPGQESRKYPGVMEFEANQGRRQGNIRRCLNMKHGNFRNSEL